jgi:hypothetical protein
MLTNLKVFIHYFVPGIDQDLQIGAVLLAVPLVLSFIIFLLVRG